MEWQHNFHGRPVGGGVGSAESLQWLFMLAGGGTVGAVQSAGDVVTAARHFNRCSDSLQRELNLCNLRAA